MMPPSVPPAILHLAWPSAWNDFALCASPSATPKPGDVSPIDRELQTRPSPPPSLGASRSSAHYATSRVTSSGGEDGARETFVLGFC
jgi:hypothetical protein